ncbi:MAG: hypothetical protein V1895_00725 [Parcubacteria group bacterium]
MYFLTRTELIEVVADRIRPGRTLFYEADSYDKCLVMLNEQDQGMLWANCMHKVPFTFSDSQDFAAFCKKVADLSGLKPESREQPQTLAYIRPERMRRFVKE